MTIDLLRQTANELTTDSLVLPRIAPILPAAPPAQVEAAPIPRAWHFRLHSRIRARAQRVYLWIRRGGRSAKRAYRRRSEEEIRAEKLARLHIEVIEDITMPDNHNPYGEVAVTILSPPPAPLLSLDQRPDYVSGQYAAYTARNLREQPAALADVGAAYRAALAEIQTGGEHARITLSPLRARGMRTVPLEPLKTDTADLFTVSMGTREEVRAQQQAVFHP